MAHAKKVRLKKKVELKQKDGDKIIVHDASYDVEVVLTDQQILFCQQYLATRMNAKEAALRAGYSPTSAGLTAARLLINPEVKKYITVLKKNLALRIGISAEMIAKEIAKIAFSDIRTFYNIDNSLKDINELSDTAASTIAGIDVFEEYDRQGKKRQLVGFTKRIKMYDKVRSLEILAKMLGVDGVTKVAQTDIEGNNIVWNETRNYGADDKTDADT